MTNRNDNDCLDAAQRWLDESKEQRSVVEDVQALIAFSLMLLLLFVGLHLEIGI